VQEHELRRRILEEMHLRVWPQLSAPMRIIQVLRVVDERDRDAELERVLAPPHGSVGVQAPRHISGTLCGGVAFCWERHREASHLSVFVRESPSAEEMREVTGWVENFPGGVIRATKVELFADVAKAEEALPEFGLRPEETVSCLLSGGVRMWSDFRIADDGYGRSIIAANGAHPADLTRVVQRLQELGNYRNMALIGLPVAQELWPRLDEAERRLEALGQSLMGSEARDDELLEQLMRQSLQVSAIATATNYRMSATAAYARLVEERLAELAPRAIEGSASLIDFTQRRLMPGVRTCASFTARLRQVSALSDQLSSLLRARIETRIENQNGKVLASLERNTSMQLQLQRLVEGLSVIAISYYAVSLIEHMLEGFEEVLPGSHAGMAVSVMTPLIVLLTWTAMRRLHKVALKRTSH
jgi:uncharacterized membrane-anchored protein